MSPPRLRHNIAALGSVQVANYIVPLLTVPYLTRVLGIDAWGQIALAQVVLLYFTILIDYGFSWSAVREIAEKRDNHEAVSRIYSATWMAQWLLLVLSFLILYVVVNLVPILKNSWPLYLAGTTVLFGQVLFPIWLMQGLERLREVAVIQLIARLILLAPIFILIDSPDDVVLAMVIQSLSGVISGGLCLYLIYRRKIVTWWWPSWGEVRGSFKSGRALFFSRGWISLYTNLIPIILGIVAGASAVALYSLADRVRGIAQSILQPISQAIFPRISLLYVNDVKAARRLLGKSLLVVTILAGTVSVSLFVLADWIVFILGGSEFEPAADVLRWLSIVPLLVGLSNVFGVQVMIPNKAIRPFNFIVGVAGLCALIFVYPATVHYGATGAAWVTLGVEMLVTVVMGLYLQRSGFFK